MTLLGLAVPGGIAQAAEPAARVFVEAEGDLDCMEDRDLRIGVRR